jgi:ATP-dependent Clp protease protease subunit
MTQRLSHAQVEAVLEYGVDVAGRRVFLHGDVDEETIGVAIRGLYMLANISRAPIELFVTSCGGDVEDTFALHDVTRTIRAPVHTVALGKCMSAAPLLVACGEPGHRWASEHTIFMVHDAKIEVPAGPPAYVEAWTEATKRQCESMNRLLAKYTKKPYRHWSRLDSKKGDQYFSAEEALEWGLIDNLWNEKD